MNGRIQVLLLCMLFNLINNQQGGNSTTQINHTFDIIPSQGCSGKFFDEEGILSTQEIKEVCDILLQSPNFIVKINKHISALVSSGVLLEHESQDFFRAVCPEFIEMCKQGFLIDLYTDDKIIILNPGITSQKTVKDAYRARVIETVRPEMVKGEWKELILKTIELIDYKNKNGTTILNQSQSSEPTTYQWTIVVPLLLGMFIAITIFLYFVGRGIINSEVFHFIDMIIKYWEQIENSDSKQIEVNTCILCFRNKNTSTFLYCNHRYHEGCMRRWLLFDSKSCPCSYSAYDGEESGTIDPKRPAVLTILDLKILCGRMLDAFRKENVYEYFTVKEQKIKEFNEKYNIYLEDICWIHPTKLQSFKNYRLFYKMYKAFKLMCCLLAFYPSNWVNSKKGRLVKKLLNVRNKGASIGRA
jgi:hypothetical protein